jgi:hypothetical protein
MSIILSLQCGVSCCIAPSDSHCPLHANELTTNSLKATTPVSVSAEHSTRSLYIPSRKARGQEIRKEKTNPRVGPPKR